MKRIVCTLCALCLAAFLCGCSFISGNGSSGGYFIDTITSSAITSSDKVTGDTSSAARPAVSSKTGKTSSTASQNNPAANSSVAVSSTSSKQTEIVVPVSSVTSVTSQYTPFVPSGEVTYYCFDKMNEEQSRLYSIINDAVDNMTEGLILLGDVLARDISLAFRAVQTDHPEYFWMPFGYIHTIEGNTHYIAFDYESGKNSVSFRYSKSERRDIEAKLEAKIAEIKKEITGSTDYEIELALHDWLCNNVTYGQTDAEDGFTAVDALCDGLAVCEGYSRAMQLLLYEFSIPCTLVTGSADNIGHMWNLVQLDGKWYHLDVTWDDPASQNPEASLPMHGYFNINDELIKKTHFIDIDFAATSDTEIADGDSYNFFLPRCTSLDMFYGKKNSIILTDDAGASQMTIRTKLGEMKKSGKKACEFYVNSNEGVLSFDRFQSKYSLQDCIIGVNLFGEYYIQSSRNSIIIIFK